MSTVTISPSEINKGTLIMAPVERVAGLLPPLAVSPFTPVSVLVISKLTKTGGTTDMGCWFHRITWQISPSDSQSLFVPIKS